MKRSTWARPAILFLAVMLTGCLSADDASITGAEPRADPTEVAKTDPGGASSGNSGARGDGAGGQNRFEGTIAAPEFPIGIDWINVAEPIVWEDLRGKIVLLDFWTYGCINCIHMIPVFERLADKYSEELVVIGIHSAKFKNEGTTENIEQVARRYGRNEPIVNDNRFTVWNSWGAQAWPTVAIVDPRGNVLVLDSGEIPFSAIDEFVSSVVARFDELEQMNREPIAKIRIDKVEPDSLLLFPGKVLADAEGGRLFISDSNHNRILITDIETGELLEVIGSGIGFEDGGYNESKFHKPQGLALRNNQLFVADLDNHAIRRIDLTDRVVSTVAGTGFRGNRGPAFGEPIVDPTQYDLRSPWALEFADDDTLFIAMAGTHQIWRYELSSDELNVAVGNGRESLTDLSLSDSELAQPSGLFFTEDKLYFADSESSSIRVADLASRSVATVSGPLENTLFDFGDMDGPVGTSRLQHPLGVTGGPDGTIFIADTYNSRIKAIDPISNTTSTLFGLGGDGGFRDGVATVAEFDEPGGIDYANGKLYVADTNNHAIRIIDLESGLVDTLILKNIDNIVSSDMPTTLIADNTPTGVLLTLERQIVGAGSGEIAIEITLPPGYKLNPTIDSFYEIASEGSSVEIAPESRSGKIDRLALAIPVGFTSGTSTLTFRLGLYYCESDEESLCILDDSKVILPLSVTEAGSARVVVSRIVELPELPSFGSF